MWRLKEEAQPVDTSVNKGKREGPELHAPVPSALPYVTSEQIFESLGEVLGRYPRTACN